MHKKSLLILLGILLSNWIQAGEVDPSRVVHAADSSKNKLNLGFLFGSGYCFMGGDMVQYNNGYASIAFGVNLSYKRFTFNFNTFTGGEQTKKEINSVLYAIDKGQKNFFAMTEMGFGYEILRKKRWHINPQIGLSFIQMGHTNVHVDENDSPIRFSLLLANEIVFKAFQGTFKQGGKYGVDVIYRSSWGNFNFAEDPKGHYLKQQLGVEFYIY